jgi:hypothetical protein
MMAVDIMEKASKDMIVLNVFDSLKTTPLSARGMTSVHGL